MAPGSLSLALAPVPVALAALVVYVAPLRERVRWFVAAGGIAATLAFVLITAIAVAAGTRPAVGLGDEVGVQLTLRADPTGIVLAAAAAFAGLLVVLERRIAGGALCGLALSVLGAVIAAQAGDAVTLFGGAEIANAGALVIVRSAGGARGRGVLAVVAVQHAAALGLLVAAVELQVTRGTSAFAALLPGALTAAVAWPWAVAAVLRLLAPALLASRGAAAGPPAWAATGAVPCAAAMLLRLRGLAGDAGFPIELTIGLAAAGGCVAALAAWRVSQEQGDLLRLGRGLLAVAAAPVVALAAFPASAGIAIAAGLCALELCVAASGAWEVAGWRGRRWLGAAAVAAAGGLPLGFGTTAVVLQLGAVVTLGRAGFALLVALLVSAAAAAMAAVRAALQIATEREPAPSAPLSSGVPPWTALGALLATVAAAVAPGAALAGVVSLMSGGPPRSAGAATVLAPGGGWAGGYLLVAAAFLVVMGIAASAVAGLRLDYVSAPAAVAGPRLRMPLVPWRLAHGAGRRAARVAGAVDRWLVLQPQLPLLIGSVLVALFLIH